jgi:hypothetical protein
MFLLESRLSPEQRAVLTRVQELSAAMGFNVYLTGGTVRDLVTGASLRGSGLHRGREPGEDRALNRKVAQTLVEDDKLRHIELLFSGDVKAALRARDDHYIRTGRGQFAGNHGRSAPPRFFPQRVAILIPRRAIAARPYERTVGY